LSRVSRSGVSGITTARATTRPDTHPDGMLRACAYWSEDERQIIGVSFWAPRQWCGAWRAPGAEARRREATAAHVLDEQEAFYRGRELAVPARQQPRPASTAPGVTLRPRAAEDAVVAMRQMNEIIAGDGRVESVMLPVRDGVTLARKR
jgi:O-methyltransferase